MIGSRKGAISPDTVHLITKLIIGIILFAILVGIASGSTGFLKEKLSIFSDCFACMREFGISKCIPMCWII